MLSAVLVVFPLALLFLVAAALFAAPWLAARALIRRAGRDEDDR